MTARTSFRAVPSPPGFVHFFLAVTVFFCRGEEYNGFTPSIKTWL